MKTKYWILLSLFSFLGCFGQAQGQVFDDWEGRPSVSVKHRFENGIGVRVRYGHYLDHNLSHYKQSAMGAKIDYKIRVNPWLKPAVDYRYGYNGRESNHDIRYYVKVSHDLSRRFQLKYYPKLQQDIASDRGPEYYVRNKLELAYAVIEPLELFVFTENYQRINGGLSFDTQKTGFGAEFQINNANELEFKFDVKNKSTHEDIARLTLKYSYIIE